MTAALQGSLMVDVAGTWLTAEDRHLLRQPEVGGLIIFARNIEHPRQVLDRTRLLDRVYGATSDHYDRSIDVQLCRLRRKLAAFGLKGLVIRTIRNEGYMFVHSVFG